MSQTFESFYEEGYAALHQNQDSFLSLHHINDYGSWNFDQPSGVFTFSDRSGTGEKKYFAFQSIGTYSAKSCTWLWAWANKTTYPNVKTASEQIKEFGQRQGFEKLTTATWEADEIDGWEMLAFAQKILNPLGVYSVASDGVIKYMIFTNELTEQEVHKREENTTELMECNNHGLARMAFICQHLNATEKTGFHECFETYENMELEEDDDFQAWCDACEDIRAACDGWDDESMELAKIKLVCEKCYFEIKEFNA